MTAITGAEATEITDGVGRAEVGTTEVTTGAPGSSSAGRLVRCHGTHQIALDPPR